MLRNRLQYRAKLRFPQPTLNIYYEVDVIIAIRPLILLSVVRIFPQARRTFLYSSPVMVSVTVTRTSYVMSCTAMNVAQRMICCVHSLYRACQRRERLIKVLVLTWHLNPGRLIFQTRALQNQYIYCLIGYNQVYGRIISANNIS